MSILNRYTIEDKFLKLLTVLCFRALLSLYIFVHCKVWFVELSRAESQRSLDEMKREMSVKTWVLPYSRETSLSSSSSSSLQHRQKAPVQSYTGVSFQSQGNLL